VFQVCTLIEQKSTFTCRQKIGRGLRLCVDQDDNRIEDRNINILHVMANESFAEFAENLQREIEAETSVKFGVLQLSLFSGLMYTESVTEEKTVTQEQAARERFETVISKADQKPVVHDAFKEVRVRLKKHIMFSPEFLALCDKNKGRTAYRVTLDENELKLRCIKKLATMERVTKARVITKTARYNIDHPGVAYTETELRAFDTKGDFHILLDFIRVLDDECLNRKLNCL